MKNISSIILNIFVVFAFVQSPLYAVLDHVEEEQQASLKRQRSSDACVKEPPTKKARQLTPKAQEAQDKLEVFEKQLAKLAETQDAEGLQTNTFLTDWRLMMIKNRGSP